jgi:hypothetical protein
VFVGYAADDPPVHYLLEALNLNAGNTHRLFAFQLGKDENDSGLWEQRGVRAISFGSKGEYDLLWDSLAAWAQYTRDTNGWYKNLFNTASVGPAEVCPHKRGQIANLFRTREGVKRVGNASPALPASWLLALDSSQRFANPGFKEPYNQASTRIDPYECLSLDFDTPPQPLSSDSPNSRRTVPQDSWDAFKQTPTGLEDSQDQSYGFFLNDNVVSATPLSERFKDLAKWFVGVAHQPIALWWVTGRGRLHPDVVKLIKISLQQNPNCWSDYIRGSWQLLIASWSDCRVHPNIGLQAFIDCVDREGWSESLVRIYVDLFRPQLKVQRDSSIRHPLTWTEVDQPSSIVTFKVHYPRPDKQLKIPDDHLAYAVTRFRENLHLARSLLAEISGNERVLLCTTRADDGHAPIAYNVHGITGAIAQFQQLMDRFVTLSPEKARIEINSWPVDDKYIFARLRIWAAGLKVTSATDAANIVLGFPDEIFWGSHQQRDLLYVIRDRWQDFSDQDRVRIETRLLTTTYPWPEDVRGGKARVEARYRLDRLYWLSKKQDIQFSFDVDAKIVRLRLIDDSWSEQAGARAADSNLPVAHDIGMDTSHRKLDNVPLDKIFNYADKASDSYPQDFVVCKPFIGLATEKPARALAALSHELRKGEVKTQYWSEFLCVEKRKEDSIRMVYAIAARLASLPSEKLSEIAYPVAQWLCNLGKRIFSELTLVLDCLWEPLIAALRLREDKRQYPVDKSWADDALNSPVGRLTQLLIMDPATHSLECGQGFPGVWTARIEQLLALPGDMRRHALVMLGFEVNWLFTIAPTWTQQHVLNVLEMSSLDDDKNALWDGMLWCAQPPSQALYERLKPTLFQYAVSSKRRNTEANMIASFMLIGWGGFSKIDPIQQLVSDDELRDILVKCDDDLRSQILRRLEEWSVDPKGSWRERLIPFLRDVWPKHSKLRTPEMSVLLTNLAMTSDDLFPQVVETILQRLVPVRDGMLRNMKFIYKTEHNLTQHYPASMLNLLWAILAEDTTVWPYKVEELLDLLSDIPATRADPRLSELRHRRRFS